MRVLALLFITLLILCLVLGCDGDSTLIPHDTIIGRVSMADGQAAPEGTTVFLVRVPLWYGIFLAVVDSTHTGPGGLFSFTGAEEGSYVLTAGVYVQGGASGWSHVAPLSETVEVPAADKVDGQVMIFLEAVVQGAEVEGVAMQNGETTEPADFAAMQLWRLEGPSFTLVDSVRSSTDGSYRFTDVWTGNHIVYGTKELVGDMPHPVPIAAESPIFFSRSQGVAVLDTLWLTDIGVDKPAVYIYPERAGRFTVDLGLGRGVRLTASDPAYGSGWNVFVDADGRIDDNHDYLFYELGLPAPALGAAGWCLDGADLAAELAELVARYGLNEAETAAFVAYWRERLPDSPYWLAQPVVGADLDRWAILHVSPAPDSVLRLWIFFRPSAEEVSLSAPTIAPFTREGTTVVEWGGGVLPRPPA